MSHTAQEVLGFASVVIGGPPDYPGYAQFQIHLSKAINSRGIDGSVPSDALDASRDLCIDEACQVLSPRAPFDWRVLNNQPNGDSTLYVALGGMPLQSVLDARF